VRVGYISTLVVRVICLQHT